MTIDDIKELIKRIADTRPVVPSEIDGSLSCFFCGADDPENDKGEKHKDDCIWLAACAERDRPPAPVDFNKEQLADAHRSTGPMPDCSGSYGGGGAYSLVNKR